MYVMYNFDEVIDRRHTNAMNTDGFRGYIFHADETMTFVSFHVECKVGQPRPLIDP